MSDGIKPTRIEREGYALPDEVSIDGDYTGDDVDWDSSPGMLGFDQWKQPVRAATTAAITIATALNNGDTLDGVTLATGDRVLVKDQGASAEQNGIYIVGTTPARADDMDEDAEVLGAVVYVIDGTANAATIWTVTNDTATIVDTDDINWAQLSGGGGGVTVADEGTPLSTTATTLDFVGAGVTASGTGATKTITIPGGSGIVVKDEGSTLTTDATTLDFVGAGVTASGTGATKTITIPGGSSAFSGARVYNSGNVSLSSGTETTITYDSERYDTDAFHSTSSNTSRLTVPTGLGGTYHIGAGVSITTSSGTPTYIRILLNGTTVIAVAHVTESASFEAATIACDYALAQGDYVEFQVYVQNGSKNAIAAANYSPEFWLHKIN